MKRFVDHHVHTEFSGDCEELMENVVEKARQIGLDRIIFTDHVDYDYPECDVRFDEIDYEKYIEKMEKLKAENNDMEMLLGVEIGYQPHLGERIQELLESRPFDFVIVSIHSCNGFEFCNGGFFEGKTKSQAYAEYLESVRYCVENFDDWDVLGHMDFIARYGDFDDKGLDYFEFKDTIDCILNTIIRNGKGIELNTSGIRYGLDNMHPQTAILRRYRELGGEIVTLGSDAHKACDMCADFEMAIGELKKAGFEKLTQFKGRKAEFVEI